MPVLIAVAVATVVVTVVLTLVARRGRVADPADVRAGALGLVEQAHRHPALRRFVLDRRDTTKATGLLLTVALAMIAGLTLAVGLVLEMVQTSEGFARWDDSAARWGAAHTTGTAESVVRIITQLGSTPVVIALCLVVSMIEYHRVPTRAVPAFLITVVASQLVITNLIKVVVGRDRPDIARLVSASGFSFPSGHTAASAALYSAIALVAGRGRGRRAKAILAGVAGGIAIAVATSRVLLGAHWLTDVIAGLALGWACFALASIAYGGRLLHFGAPVEKASAVLATESAAANTSVPPTSRSHA
ncbi:MAG: phosphatase PAP2 family protein [Ilumatobacteraceae bacterium]